jgi:hypothetical protein
MDSEKIQRTKDLTSALGELRKIQLVLEQHLVPISVAGNLDLAIEKLNEHIEGGSPT